MKKIPLYIDLVCDLIGRKSENFLETFLGKSISAIILFGPASMLPQIFLAIKSENIDALINPSWFIMFWLNIISFILLCQKGTWQMRLTVFLWAVVMFTMSVIVYGRWLFS